ncbi:O-antigen ligase family protein [Marinobacter nauticus]|uniref:O-antigen ligase family protein n=1 Tax=Marinobacter nauticus TaxID=2743 RepID=UPI0037357650
MILKTSRVGIATEASFVAITLLAVLFADFLPTSAGSYADQRFLLVAWLGGITIVSTYLLISRGVWIKPAFVQALPFILLIIGFPVLSLAFTQQPYAYVEPGLYSFYFAAVILGGIALAKSDITMKCLEVLVVITAAACFLYGAMSLNVYLFALEGGHSELSDLIPWGFVNIRYWSHVATWFLPVLPLAVLMGPFANHRLWRVLVAVGAGLWWWIVFLSASRGSVLGVAVGVVVASVIIGRQCWPWLKQFLVYLVLGGFFWFVLSLLVPILVFGELELRTISQGSSGRAPLFIEAWQMSLQRFPFGMGPQSWLTHDLLTSSYAESKKFGHPHNMYLMWAAEYGWLLVLIMFWVTFQVASFLYARCKVIKSSAGSTEAVVLAALLASVVGALIHAGVSAVFIAPGSMLVGLLIMPVFLGFIVPGTLKGKRYKNDASRPLRKALQAAVIATLVFLLWGAWAVEVKNYYLDMREDESYYYQVLRERALPRFWLHGYFPRNDVGS